MKGYNIYGKKIRSALAVFGLILGAFFAIVLYQKQFPFLVKAQESNQQASKNWEYCSVYPYNGTSSRSGKNYVSAIISYARGDGYSSETVEAAADSYAPNPNFAENQAFAKAVAKLGENGWEMVGEGNSREHKVLYFKRQKK